MFIYSVNFQYYNTFQVQHIHFYFKESFYMRFVVRMDIMYEKCKLIDTGNWKNKWVGKVQDI